MSTNTADENVNISHSHGVVLDASADSTPAAAPPTSTRMERSPVQLLHQHDAVNMEEPTMLAEAVTTARAITSRFLCSGIMGDEYDGNGHETTHVRPVVLQTTLPSGDTVDCKNTLRSYSMAAKADEEADLEEQFRSNDLSEILAASTQRTSNERETQFYKQVHGVHETNIRPFVSLDLSRVALSDAKQHSTTDSSNTFEFPRVSCLEDDTGEVRAIVGVDWVYDPNGQPVVPLPIQTAHGVTAELSAGSGTTEGEQMVKLGSGIARRSLQRPVIGLFMLILVVSIVGGICGSGQCRRGAFRSPSSRIARQVIAYINNVTLTGRELVVPCESTSLEERALLFFLFDDPFDLPPTTTHTKAIWRQRYALATLLFQLPAFNTTKDACEWPGVECRRLNTGSLIDEQNEAVKLDLKNMGLKGPISVDVGLLSDLEHVDVSGNDMTGTLPSTLGQWTNLEFFDISSDGNGMTGTLPTTFGQWTNLVYFNVSSNLLNGTIPDDVGRWTSVAYFSVGGNNLTGSLSIDLWSWSSHLVRFDVQSNKLAGRLPHDDALARLARLTHFEIGDNDISGTLPKSIARWDEIEFFSVWDNLLTGTIPSEYGRWINLRVFDIGSNILIGTIPDAIGQWKTLTTFIVNENNLFGTMPTSIKNWPAAFHIFDISENALTGTLPELIGHWNPYRCDVHSNALNGTLPKSIGSWTSVKTFTAGQNYFTGRLPDDIAEWTLLEHFDVSGNALSGTLTEAIYANWNNLHQGYFYWNNFSGIPQGLCYASIAPELEYLSVDCAPHDVCACCTCYQDS